MKRLAILASLLALAAPARAASRNIHENTDPYTGLRTLFLEVNTRACPGDPSPGDHDPDVHLLFTAMENPDHTVTYFVAPELDQAGYTLNLRTKDTMDTLIDGAVGTFVTPAGSTTTNRYSGGHSYLHETIPFSLSSADLARLSNAEWFQFRINGQRYAIQRCTDAKRLRDLAEFADAASEYGPPERPVSSIPKPNPLPKPIVVQQTSSVPKPFIEHTNPTNQLKTLTLPDISTQPCPGDTTPQDAVITLSISANQREAGRVWFYVNTEIYRGASLGLSRGGNMPIQIDGTPGIFHTIKGSVLSNSLDASGNPAPHETTSFHVDRGEILALKKTTVFEFSVNGPNGPIRRCAQTDPFKYLTDFLNIAATYEPVHRETAALPQ